MGMIMTLGGYRMMNHQHFHRGFNFFKRSKVVFFLFALILMGQQTSPLMSCTENGQEGIVEENSLKIGVHDKMANDMTQERFNTIIQGVETIYSPIVRALGKTLRVEKKWEDGTVNAYAQQLGNIWQVTMFGGLARHETVSDDAFALVVCHEIGHHLGGAPRKASWFGITWASNEGQADYWGTMKCLRKYFEKDDNVTIVSRMDVPEYATEVCKKNFSDPEEVAMCQRGSMAGLSLGNLFRALKNLRTKLAFHTPDSAVVNRTDDNHPAPQCRLDTYFAGAVCSADAYTDVSPTDHNQGVCSVTNGDEWGKRPLCWYKPATL
jgi:hypothetical protein